MSKLLHTMHISNPFNPFHLNASLRASLTFHRRASAITFPMAHSDIAQSASSPDILPAAIPTTGSPLVGGGPSTGAVWPTGGAGGAGGASAVSVVSVAAAVSVVVVLPEACSSAGAAGDVADGWAGSATCVPDADPEDAVPADAVSVWLEAACSDAGADAVSEAFLSA